MPFKVFFWALNDNQAHPAISGRLSISKYEVLSETGFSLTLIGWHVTNLGTVTALIILKVNTFNFSQTASISIKISNKT